MFQVPALDCRVEPSSVSEPDMADRAGATEFVGAVVTLVALDAAVLAIAGPRFAESITELTVSRG